MEKRDKLDLNILETLKRQKLAEILGTEVEEKAEEEQPKKKKIKINFKKLKQYFLVIIFLSMIAVIVFLGQKYIQFQDYLRNTKEIIGLGEKYKEEQRRKEEQLKELKNLTLENINTLPDEKKEVMLNIIPSGSPLIGKIDITSTFGTRSHPVSGRTREHHGLDLRVRVGDPVVSTAMGRVSFSGVKGGYGYTVVVDHMYGFQTLYAHLDKLHVKVGEIVGKGKIIADGGNSGVSTGPHLHYEVRYNKIPINPNNFLEWDKKNFNILFEKERSIQWEYFLTIMGKN